MAESTRNDPKDTRARILEAADRLFGARGFRGTSMRALTAAAGVNLAAVNYHFGSKEALLRETLSRHMEPINAERLRRLDKLEAEHHGVVPVEWVLDALFRPTFEFTHASEQNAADIQRVVAMIHSESSEAIRPLFAEVFRPISDRFVAALGRTFPELDARVIEMRLQFGAGCMIHLISRRSPIVADVPDGELLEHMLAYLAAGFRAPTPENGP